MDFLVGMRDFEIDGNGTELLFTGFISPFSLEDCENITVRDPVSYTHLLRVVFFG